MLLVLALAAAALVILLLLLALFARHPHELEARAARRLGREADPRRAHRMPIDRLLQLVLDLVSALGLRVDRMDGSRRDGSVRMLASGPAVLGEARYVIYVESAPEGEVVEAPVLLELAEEVKQEHAEAGFLITTFAIDVRAVAGLDVSLRLIDGDRLRALVAEHLPGHAGELAGYRVGTEAQVLDEGLVQP